MPSKNNRLTVRPMREDEYSLMIRYFVDASDEFLLGMGVDIEKLPDHDTWLERLLQNHAKPDEEKDLFYVTWLKDDHPVGHGNMTKLEYGKHGFMHLHLWHETTRKQGLATQFLLETISIYFDRFDLQSVFSEPNAHNPGPNRTLPKLGFQLVTTEDTTPGVINLFQTVNRWKVDRAEFPGQRQVS